MSTRFFDRDPVLGTTKFFHYDDDTDDGSFTIETVQDVTAAVEANKALANAETHDRFSEFRRVASIPLALFYTPEMQKIVQDEPAFRKWLDERDNRVFRVDPEHLS